MREERARRSRKIAWVHSDRSLHFGSFDLQEETAREEAAREDYRDASDGRPYLSSEWCPCTRVIVGHMHISCWPMSTAGAYH